MLRKYRNQLIDVIRAAELDPSAFEPQLDEASGVFRLQLRRSPLRFTFVPDRGNHHYFTYRYVSYGPEMTERVHDHESHSFPTVAEAFEEWLFDSAKSWLEERETPDLWQSLTGGEALVAAEADDNRPFSEEEIRRIRESLDFARDRIEEVIGLSAAQSALLTSKLDYLVEAASRTGRLDWKNLVAGTLMAYYAQAALSSPAASAAFQVIGDALRWLYVTQALLP